MTMISQQTGMVFAYNPLVVNVDRLVSTDIIHKEAEQAIALLLDNLYSYTIKGKYIIIISEKEPTETTSGNEIIIVKIKKEEDTNSGTSIDSCLSNIRAKKIALNKLESNKPIEITNHINDTIMLKKIVGIIALSAITTGSMDAQVQQQEVYIQEEVENVGLEKSLMQLSFIHPLGTDGGNSKNKEYKFSLNMLGGINGAIDGFELGGLFNITRQNMKGVQIGGLFNSVGGNVKGVQIAGVMNHSKKSGGIQIGGVMNYSKDFAQVQIAGVTNYAANVGTQISVVNVAQNANFQLGVVNISETGDGTMLGLFNYVKKGGLFEIGLSTNDYIYGAFNLITGTDRLYSILSIGRHSSNVMFGVGIGTRFQLKGERYGLHLELMQNNIFKDDFKDMSRSASLNQLRVFYSQRINKFTFYGGPTVNALLTDVDFTNSNKPIYSIVKHNGSKHNFNLWVGAEIGVRFNLK